MIFDIELERTKYEHWYRTQKGSSTKSVILEKNTNGDYILANENYDWQLWLYVAMTTFNRINVAPIAWRYRNDAISNKKWYLSQDKSFIEGLLINPTCKAFVVEPMFG